MGYMGFGMQKWIYRRRPRAPFSKKTEPGYDTLPSHSPEEFTTYGSPSQNMNSLEERIRMGKSRLKNRWLRNQMLSLFYAAAILCIIAYIVFRFVV